MSPVLAPSEGLSRPGFSGLWPALIVMTLIAGVFLFKAVRAPTRSRRLANLAIFAGLLAFVPVEIATGWVASRDRGALMISGAARLTLALGGLVSAAAAFALRKQDSGHGILRPGVGGLLCLLHLSSGIALLLLPALYTAPPSPPVSAGSAPAGAESPPSPEGWVYRSDPHDLSISLPSRDWVQARLSGAVAAFRARSLPVTVGVFVRAGELAAHEEHVRAFQEDHRKAGTRVSVTEGSTAAGDSYFLGESSEPRPDGSGDFLITTCFLFRERRKQTVVFIIEAAPRTKSSLGKSFEHDAIRQAARTISLSVR